MPACNMCSVYTCLMVCILITITSNDNWLSTPYRTENTFTLLYYNTPYINRIFGGANYDLSYSVTSSHLWNLQFTNVWSATKIWTVKLDMAWIDFFGKLLNLMISMSIVWASSLEKRTWGRRLLQKKSWVNIWPRKSGQEKRVQIISWSIISFPIVLFVNVPACAGNLNLCESTTNKAQQSIQIKMIHTNF